MAFNGLFTTPRPQDQPGFQRRSPGSGSAEGGGDEAAGSGSDSCDNAAAAGTSREPLKVPPVPAPPIRLPRRTRGLDSSCASACGSLSPPGTPASNSSESLTESRKVFRGSHVAKGEALALLSSESLKSLNSSRPAKGEEAWWGLPPSACDPQSEEEREPSPAGKDEDPPTNAQPPRQSEAEQKERLAAAAADRRKKALDALRSKQLQDDKQGDYCCFRDPKTVSKRRGACEAIREDRPQTAFDLDVMVLELHSVLRRHAIEPSEDLVNDVLKWQVRAAQRSARGKPSEEMMKRH
eukprot:gnl/TRDRNA2_/TRDRNA2_87787_c0_seq2.p1 gnl/TRDRNA2_/TRDRNA2_87787_c0~~gnl/TRDRNA2_/TRDRNA2_87787_c0_seq2.p1  ORF type:complete len:295 (+),score=61.88 gnl/TRDRNA2_/TRDRNA2_87787_c0_seq2:107-991(+)